MLLEASPPPVTRGPPAKVGGLLVYAACELFNVSAEKLRSANRTADVTRARWALSYVLIERCGWTLTRVANLLDLHHTAVLYGWRKAVQLYRTEQSFFEAVEELEKLI